MSTIKKICFTSRAVLILDIKQLSLMREKPDLCRNWEKYLNSVLPVVHRNLAMEISIYFPRQTLFCVKSAKSCCSASSFINSSSFCEIANCWQLCYKVDNNQLTRHANNDAFREGSTLMPAGAKLKFSKINPNQNW